MCACIWHVPNVFSVLRHATYRCETSGRLSYLDLCLHQHIFLAKHDRFRIGEFCVWHKILFVLRNVPWCTAITVPGVRIYTALEARITCVRTASAFLFVADLPPLSPARCCFWGHSAAAKWPSFCTCCKENSVLRYQLIISWIYWNSLSWNSISSCHFHVQRTHNANRSARN
jgi:hypothetical protein